MSKSNPFILADALIARRTYYANQPFAREDLRWLALAAYRAGVEQGEDQMRSLAMGYLEDLDQERKNPETVDPVRGRATSWRASTAKDTPE